MLEVGTVKYHFYFDSRHPLPVKLMYWGNVLFPALTLLWAIAEMCIRDRCGNSASAVVLILIVWALILLMGLVLTYWKRKRQMKKLLDMAKPVSYTHLDVYKRQS